MNISDTLKKYQDALQAGSLPKGAKLDCPLVNYAIPGLWSYIMEKPSSPEDCLVRLFHMHRFQNEGITPHSHRFDFSCLVLEGLVTNRVWRRLKAGSSEIDSVGDLYIQTHSFYLGKPGKYRTQPGSLDYWAPQDQVYQKGEVYSMKAEEVHSIVFSKGAKVLFFEGPAVSDSSIYLEPFVGEVCTTMEVKPWMFQAHKS